MKVFYLTFEKLSSVPDERYRYELSNQSTSSCVKLPTQTLLKDVCGKNFSYILKENVKNRWKDTVTLICWFDNQSVLSYKLAERKRQKEFFRILRGPIYDAKTKLEVQREEILARKKLYRKFSDEISELYERREENPEWRAEIKKIEEKRGKTIDFIEPKLFLYHLPVTENLTDLLAQHGILTALLSYNEKDHEKVEFGDDRYYRKIRRLKSLNKKLSDKNIECVDLYK